MPRRLTNLVLLALTTGLVGTGVGGWALPLDLAAPLFPLHRALAVALALAVAWKAGMARRSLSRRVPRGDASVALGAGAALALAVSLVIGFGWSAGALGPASFGGYSALNVHVFAGVGLALVVAAHLALRWERRPPLGKALSRRAALRVGALGIAAFALTSLLDSLEPLRRLTGSKHAGSFTGNGLPVTTWTFDSVPNVDVGSWRLDVAGRSLSYDELTVLPRHQLAAVLDCTSGWWSEQHWSGVRLGEILRNVAAREVRVVSVTGHAWTFPRVEADSMLLATHLGDETLSPAHGYPLRLVAPGRRGFQWVKWVSRIETY
ncbi:MAG: hypothetical protein AUH85_03880 [Chloroflexi bacterium 13_1_40CM_4_68_4]|nr:MAG: hypothetical protein AUH85_03880 [Chloroflexi bacterium 13_1_40CM_4_68_4]